MPLHLPFVGERNLYGKGGGVKERERRGGRRWGGREGMKLVQVQGCHVSRTCPAACCIHVKWPRHIKEKE